MDQLSAPFGCLVEYIPAKTNPNKLEKMEPKADVGIFLGYVSKAGGRVKDTAHVIAR